MTQSTATAFRQEMLDTVERRHCKRHPLTEMWARGELSKEQLGRWAIEHYHFTRDLHTFFGRILANCDVQAGRDMELDNLADEQNPEDPHNRQLLDFVDACGLNTEELIRRAPLPTTQALRDWLFLKCERASWQEAAAGIHVGMEAQLAPICDRLVPSLQTNYAFDPHAIRFFVTHQTADIEHGGRALAVIERYTPEELRPRVIQAVNEGTEKRWLYFDGVYVKYVLGYNIGNQPG
ncbi:MAG TPA: iron-containing redox enzyme family protein [Chloroflexota bacterium]|nr:iron-containing redox enzyme family protein [Chloroflexota bacterium]